MKNTGVVRRIDGLGRIVIPMEYRRTLGINERDPLSISLAGDRIVVERHKAACTFCGQEEGVRTFRGQSVCNGCMEALRGL